MTEITYNKKVASQIDKKIKQYRKSIPERFNQIELLDYLTKPEYELFCSISNRSDGKTFGYLGTLLMLAMEFDQIKLLILCRHDELKSHYADVIEQIIEEKQLKRDKFNIKPTSVGVRIYYNNRIIACISDLNDATDLKNASAFLKQFKVMVYDEFLAIKADYNPQEAYQLETIIGSVNRSPENNDVIPHPKLFLLGNAVNFDSPILAYYDLINLFETQDLNTLETYGPKVVELRLNEHSQEENTTSLVAKDSPANTALFEINTSMVVPFKEKPLYTGEVVIKVDEIDYLVIKYKPDLDFYLEFTVQPPGHYEYCIRLADFKEGVQQLNEYDFNRFSHFDYDQHLIKFGNTYSINYIDNQAYLKDIDIRSLIVPYAKKADPKNVESIYKKQEFEDKKQLVQRKFDTQGDF